MPVKWDLFRARHASMNHSMPGFISEKQFVESRKASRFE
jgi:hypothetical protein